MSLSDDLAAVIGAALINSGGSKDNGAISTGAR